MNLQFRVSDFCHFLRVADGITAMYNSLGLGVIFLTNEIAEIFSNAIGGIIKEEDFDLSMDEKEEIFRALIERKLIFPLGERYDLEDYLKIQKLLNDEGVAVLYLLLTDGCNLGCSYCYIENILPGNYSFSMMKEETAMKGLELFASKISQEIEEPKVILYGGEPLLNMDLVFKVINRFNEMKLSGKLPSKTSLTINTNATLINTFFLDFVQDKNIQIAVSLDGTKEMHDAMRKYKNGSGTYDKVIRNCELMVERGVNFGFSVTITKANINCLEDVLLWIYEKFGIRSIGFNIAIHQTEKILGMSEEQYAELVTQKLINCFKICRNLGIYEDRIMRKVDAFVKGYPYAYDCGAPGDQFVVSPEGLIGVCQAYCGDKKYFVPMSEIDSEESRQIWRDWRSRSPLYQKQCYQCISLGICGGGCPYNAELRTGSIWGIDKSFCTHSKGTVEFLIKDLYEQTVNG